VTPVSATRYDGAGGVADLKHFDRYFALTNRLWIERTNHSLQGARAAGTRRVPLCTASDETPVTPGVREVRDLIAWTSFHPTSVHPHPRSSWVAEGELERSVGPEGPLGPGQQRFTLERPVVDYGLHPTRRHDAHDRSHARSRDCWLLSVDRRRGSNVNG
jgi:hypothetical protein